MKRKMKVMVEVEKCGLFGKRKAMEERVVWVDDSTYRRLKRERGNRPFSLAEMMMYDEIFGDGD